MSFFSLALSIEQHCCAMSSWKLRIECEQCCFWIQKVQMRWHLLLCRFCFSQVYDSGFVYLYPFPKWLVSVLQRRSLIFAPLVRSLAFIFHSAHTHAMRITLFQFDIYNFFNNKFIIEHIKIHRNQLVGYQSFAPILLLYWKSAHEDWSGFQFVYFIAWKCSFLALCNTCKCCP